MSSEIRSTARPTPLRLWGFLATAAGTLVAGIGATLDWAVIGFPGDERGTLDVAVKGTDVWEGKVALAAAVLALVLTLVLRLPSSADARRALALAVVTLGALSMALAISVAVRPTPRFAGTQGLDQIATDVSDQLGIPVAEVEAQLHERYGDQLSVDRGTGLWVTIAGGLFVVVGGSLSLAWARGPGRGSEASGASRRSEAPPAGPAGPGDPPAP